ncbi:G-type lectin S-receptor-like serine/threonine-protein kinase At2g19130 [Triticum urartu]|uniref:G-type lectin S-receptor-like serine/threonine-protein kinase At2g19130 n=1 Tax=Triticum urartu TaxID=4572 RepID=UPI0020438329|nr:G-type lectin S-receptor-like serine/threonine-protein kinase At2g19130 [Triticum urartu]
MDLILILDEMKKARERMPSTSSFGAVILYLIIIVASSRCRFAHATDTLLEGQSLYGNGTLLSKNGAFELGFGCLFPPDYIFGIWYVNSSACSTLLVWSSPQLQGYRITDPRTMVLILSNGNLQLTSLTYGHDAIIWSSDGTERPSESTSTVAVLLDNGDLVIRDQVNSSLLFWHSFEELTDTLLPGGPLGFRLISNRGATSNVSCAIYSKLWTDQYIGRLFKVITYYSSAYGYSSTNYSDTFPSWMDNHEDEDSTFLSNKSDVYVRLHSDGTVTAAKLWGCGTVLWSAQDSRQEKPECNQQMLDSKKEKSYPKIKIDDLIIAMGVLTAIFVYLVLLWRSRNKLSQELPLRSDSSLKIFSNMQIKKATKNFSEKIGEGGFGCFYKGALAGFSLVAVKRLKCIGQGEKQFRAEVQTIGIINHINLVRLFGFCAKGRKRLLVYEYMENGSLSSHLFSKSSTILSWDLRYQIALGTARGLAYLHEECKECIMHCDMKPDNVLLDAKFCPKIADFGMAKLLGRDFSRALTTMRGTIGYLAPEWISGLPITHKTDVYSYGMMLLEIISGRRNSEKIKEGKFTYFPIFAAIKVNEGDAMCLLDSRLEGQADVEQLSRACRIACWCIQDAEDHRPMMGQVVHMLGNVMDVEIPPIPRSLENYIGMEDCSYSVEPDNLL